MLIATQSPSGQGQSTTLDNDTSISSVASVRGVEAVVVIQESEYNATMARLIECLAQIISARLAAGCGIIHSIERSI